MELVQYLVVIGSLTEKRENCKSSMIFKIQCLVLDQRESQEMETITENQEEKYRTDILMQIF
jgi:hypothetical protein